MKALFQKAVFVACVAPVLLFAKEELTGIASYVLQSSELPAQKLFQNDTSKKLILKWQVQDSQGDLSYVQEPVIPAGGHIVVNFTQALELFAKKSRLSKKQKYEVDISLGVMVKTPHRSRMARQIRKLKGGEKGVRITKKDFVNKDHIVFYKDVSGKILYHAL